MIIEFIAVYIYVRPYENFLGGLDDPGIRRGGDDDTTKKRSHPSSSSSYDAVCVWCVCGHTI
jgi:hypothetical protein